MSVDGVNIMCSIVLLPHSLSNRELLPICFIITQRNYLHTPRNEYFSELLKRIVITVMLRVIPPLQGANIVHSCATILGLILLTKPPDTILVIHGMRKTNTLKQGYNFIVKAFKRFGEIKEAAIAPRNHGFGA